MIYRFEYVEKTLDDEVISQGYVDFTSLMAKLVPNDLKGDEGYFDLKAELMDYTLRTLDICTIGQKLTFTVRRKLG